MSSSSIITTRKTRSTNIHFNSIDESIIFDDFHSNLHSSIEFIRLYKEYSQKQTSQTILINILCQILSLENLDNQIILFIFDCFIENYEYLTEIQFKQNLLPYIKQIFTINNDLSLSTIRLFIVLVEHRSNILTTTLAEWLSYLLNFLVKNLSSTTYIIYKDLIIDLLRKIIKQFTPLSKEIVDILGRLSIISTNFLNQLKSWIKNSDDIHLALFSIHLWETLAALFSRLLIRGHTKGNEMLSVIEDAFIVSNYSIRSEAFSTWSIFMLHIHQFEDPDLLNNRLLKLFLTPFLSDSTSKSKSASISKCHSWITLIRIYPKNIHEIILPFLSFAFGNHLSSNTISTTTAWWLECRQIGGEFLQKFLIENIHGEYIIKLASDQILNYLFDSILDQLLEYKINSDKNLENSLWLNSWNAYLNHLMNIFKTNNSIHDEQRMTINACLLTRIEQLWIDSRIETRFLLKLFETFEQISFPLAIETVLRDSSTRTKTLSAAQIHPSATNHKSQDKSLYYRTTLSDQYLHMMLEHAIRFNDEDQTIEESYLHVLTYLIDTLSKSSDENFCYQTSSLLLKCSVEYSHQPLIIPDLFWHIWYRCSTHLINILNRSQTFELNNKIDNQKQETSIELLLRPFAFNDIERLDYSYTLIWIQLFKALCRLTLINNDHLIHLFIELLRNEPAFEQAINNQDNQRLFGFILIIIKTLLKTFSDIDLTKINDRSNNFFPTIHKRSSLSLINLCFTQFSTIINHILQRLLSNNENTTQYILVYNCLSKSTKISSNEQTKIFVFTYIRDLIIDLFNLCKTYSHLEMILKNLTQLIPFLYLYEQINHINLPLNSSPISKQQLDNAILNKILTVINFVFQPTNSSSLLQLIYPILILAFQHQKTIIRNKTRKCWNETFGRLTFIVYPNELRICLRELKDKEHLLLPCFLADHDNSNTAGSGQAPSSTDESQLSQQIDIPTQLITQQKPLSPARCLPPVNRSINSEKSEPIFVPIIQNQTNSPVIISKRLSSINSCLTEKQKEKLRTRHNIPLLCDENSNTQSNSCTIDKSINKEIKTNLTLFNQTISNEEETSIIKKLRHSSCPSMSGRKSLRQKISLPLTPNVVNQSSIEQIQKFPIKSILKRLSPRKSRQEHKRHVVFHDQVKVLVFPSPSRRDSIPQQKRKDEFKSPTRIIPKENLPLRKQRMSARRLEVINNNNEQIISTTSIDSNKKRSSKLFHPNDVLADWTQNQGSNSIFPSLIDCDKSIDCLMNFLYDGLCPQDVLNYFHSNQLNTIGDIARLTSSQIENFPIPSPKLTNIQKAFSLYQKHLINSLSVSSITIMDNTTNTTTLIPIASTSDVINDNISSISDTNVRDKLYDVDTLIDSLDCEKLDLNDEISISTNQIDIIHTKRQIELINCEEFNSPQKRCLSPTIEDKNLISPKKQILSNQTLGDRLQKAADIFKTNGILPFDDDYIELFRQLFNNSSLTHLEQLHLKTLFRND